MERIEALCHGEYINCLLLHCKLKKIEKEVSTKGESNCEMANTTERNDTFIVDELLVEVCKQLHGLFVSMSWSTLSHIGNLKYFFEFTVFIYLLLNSSYEFLSLKLQESEKIIAINSIL